MKLLCLSGDKTLGERVSAEADRLNWNAIVIEDRKELSEAMFRHDPDLLLVEIDGLADLDWWKDTNISTQRPVVFLNQEWSEEFVSKALDYGADAFIHRPLFSSRHFEARIRSLFRFQQSGKSRIYLARLSLQLDSEQCTAEIKGQALDLTLTEFKILRELASQESEVIPRFTILMRAFGQAEPSNRSLDVHICSLRKKVRVHGLDIESVRGVGYRLILVTPQGE